MSLIIGHRGGRDLWPENSLSGFRNLLDLPVEGVEFDVHLTKTGEMLVIHDATLERTTNGSGPVADLDPAERRNVVLTNSDAEAIPTLDEVLAIYAPTELELHVELKADVDGRPYEGLEAKAIAAIKAHDIAERTFLTSFSFEVLARVRDLAPGIRTIASMNAASAGRFGLADGLRGALAVADVVAVEKALLRERWSEITTLTSPDRLGVWTPNEDEELKDWLSRPLYHLTTDRPDLAVQQRTQTSTLRGLAG